MTGFRWPWDHSSAQELHDEIKEKDVVVRRLVAESRTVEEDRLGMAMRRALRAQERER